MCCSNFSNTCGTNMQLCTYRILITDFGACRAYCGRRYEDKPRASAKLPKTLGITAVPRKSIASADGSHDR